jgi:hypothetical protein
MTRAQQLRQQKTQEIMQKQEQNNNANKPTIALGYNGAGTNSNQTQLNFQSSNNQGLQN